MSLLEPGEGVILIRQRCGEVMAPALVFRPVDYTDVALKPRPRKRVAQSRLQRSAKVKQERSWATVWQSAS